MLELNLEIAEGFDIGVECKCGVVAGLWVLCGVLGCCVGDFGVVSGLTFTESSGYITQCSMTPAMAPAVMCVLIFAVGKVS